MIFSTQSFAQSDDVKATAGSIEQTAAPNNRLDVNETARMTGKLCAILHKAEISENISITELFDEVLFKHSGIDPDSQNARLRLANFWNENSARIICPTSAGLYQTQHIFKRAIQLNLHKDALFDYFLSNPVEFPIDANVVEIYPNGKSSTLLDFIDAVLSSPNVVEKYNVGQIKRLKRIIEVRFDGKRSNELSAHESEKNL